VDTLSDLEKMERKFEGGGDDGGEGKETEHVSLDEVEVEDVAED
jgi:hypothetical protein